MGRSGVENEQGEHIILFLGDTEPISSFVEGGFP
jgi:hypothetical protein